MKDYDLFIFAAEDSADVHGANLIKELLDKNPDLKILDVASPRIRQYNIDIFMSMEDFHVMGFIDVIFSLHKLIKHFFSLRKKILKENPKACVFIDYPDFTLRLEKSLRKKGYRNKLIHYVSPTVWAWREKRADEMAKHLDMLLTIFPFEKKYYSHTNLDVKYIGHPLFNLLKDVKKEKVEKKLIGIFPGSRKTEIERNLPLQLEVCKRLLIDDDTLHFAVSETHSELIRSIFEKHELDISKFTFFSFKKNYELMPKLKFAMATSGTINLELALNRVPTVVNFAIKPLDVFIARKILKINLRFYSIVNILVNEEIFFELYGPNLSELSLYEFSKKMLYDEKVRKNCYLGLERVIETLKSEDANRQAAELISSRI